MFTSIDKALVALVGSTAFIGDYFGVFHLDAQLQASIAAALPVLVWLIPNKRKA